MTSDREPGLGEETFPGFLHRAGSRIKGVYFGAMGVWTLVQGLPLVAGLVISRLIDRAQGGPSDATAWLLLGIAAGLMLARAAVLMGALRMTFTLIFRASSWIKVEVLGRLMSGRTVIAIAHRLSTVRSFDRVVVMQLGKVVQDGPPDHLVLREGLYRQLVQREMDRLNRQAAA